MNFNVFHHASLAESQLCTFKKVSHYINKLSCGYRTFICTHRKGSQLNYPNRKTFKHKLKYLCIKVGLVYKIKTSLEESVLEKKFENAKRLNFMYVFG